MSLANFFAGNIAPCVGIIFLLIFLRENSMLEANIKRLFYQLIGMVLVELVAYNVELWTATLAEPTVLRLLMSAIGYSLRPLLVYMILCISSRRNEKDIKDYLLMIPAILNILVAFSVFVTDMAYSYDAQNVFHRGPLGFTPQVMAVFYLLILLAKSLVDMRRQKEKRLESIILLLVTIYVSATMAVEAVFLVRTIGRTAIVLSIIFYYMFFQTQQFSDSMNAEYLNRLSAEERAKKDGATGLLNKAGFQEEAENALAEGTKVGTALLFIDLDHFKLVNDQLGHLSGDSLLQETASLLRGFWRANDVLGRFGGDEFCVLVREIPYDVLCKKLTYLLDLVRGHYPCEKYPINITLSIGVAYMTEKDSVNLTDVLELADNAVYEAKNDGRDCYKIHYVDKESGI